MLQLARGRAGRALWGGLRRQATGAQADDMVGGAKADVDTARSESLDGRAPSLEIDEL